MSAIGPFPSSATSTIAQRDNAPQAAQMPGPERQVQQGIRSELAQAVTQSQSVSRGEKSAWTPVKVITDKQGRLVGPPPTFEVNILETLRAASVKDGPETPPTASHGYAETRNITDDPVGDLTRRL